MPKIKGNGKASLWIDEDLSTFLSLDMIASHPERVLLIGLLQFTGERIGAVLQLQVEDCYESSGKPRQQILFRKRTRKGKDSSREVPVSRRLADCLKAFSPPKTGYLFQSPLDPNQPMSYGNCHRWLCLALEKAELKSKGYSWHSFRRTFTTKLAKRLPISELQKLTGHKSLDVLRGYIEVDEQAIAKALESL
jgi:integrase/recombinase XerD